MDNSPAPVVTPIVSSSSANSSRNFPFRTIFMIFMIVVLITCIGVLAYLLNAEKQKVAKFRQAADKTKELASIIEKDVYTQFEKVDQRGHSISTMTCGEIVASNNYRTTKPEYVRLVQNGACDSHSDVFKANFSAFTPQLQKKSQEINGIYDELGVGRISGFDGKPDKNYLFDTCWKLIQAGSCDIGQTF
jgi:DNA-directed RNA polymerase subunit N (RpoN/RPB10)